MPVLLRPGDLLGVGARQFEFRSHRFETGSAVDAYRTVANVQPAKFAMVVGDIASFSTISEYTADGVLLVNIDRLYGGLRSLLGGHRGTLSNDVGDAFSATWELAAIPEAAAEAVSFALETSPSTVSSSAIARTVLHTHGSAAGRNNGSRSRDASSAAVS